MTDDSRTASSDDVLAAVIEIVSEETGLDASQITGESRFDDLDIDSLGLLTVATQAEEHFGVSIEDSVIPTLPTVGALADLVVRQRN
ncbi:acyl carrier protein [Actinomyces sp. 2119]|uniref:Acyl carrier protein n=1 Tax=Actinomyces lilanjuaniae TaxID=2321394 RepID=A0ABM6Z3J1_9ACTO|nr:MULTISPECIES: acyl carrier protein [Actinomyces]AYD89702.1 acyl carrier protein [Actinomyces lilanjuaniae]RJF44665.1 acyl carrier protein [Actinomyces sp. 2119]